jgi:RNA polymerase sigma-70 factor (ECF subfamily)
MISPAGVTRFCNGMALSSAIAATPEGGGESRRCCAWRLGGISASTAQSARKVTGVLADEFPGVLRAAACGDEGAFARLWRDAHPPLLRYLRVLAGDAAEDVAAESWVDVARGLARFRGDERAFRGWLFTLGRRRAIDTWRYADRHPVRLTADPLELDRRSAEDTAESAVDNLSTEAALALIATLPRDQAEVIMLRVIAGLDVQHVAQIVGKRPGAVRVAAHRGLRALAARLSEAADREGVTG